MINSAHVREQLDTNLFKITDRLMHVGLAMETLAGGYSLERDVNEMISHIEWAEEKYIKIEKKIISIVKEIEKNPSKQNREKLRKPQIEYRELFTEIKPTLIKYQPHVDEMVRGPFDEIKSLVPEINRLINSVRRLN